MQKRRLEEGPFGFRRVFHERSFHNSYERWVFLSDGHGCRSANVAFLVVFVVSEEEEEEEEEINFSRWLFSTRTTKRLVLRRRRRQKTTRQRRRGGPRPRRCCRRWSRRPAIAVATARARVFFCRVEEHSEEGKRFLFLSFFLCVCVSRFGVSQICPVPMTMTMTF